MDDTDLQRWIAAQLRRRREVTAEPELVEAAARHLQPGLKLSPAEQLEIYRQQFWLRHTAALLEDFPMLAALLGQERWEALAEAYLEQVELTSFSLRDLGRELAAFVARQRWLDAPELYADVASFEWARVEAFDAADADPVSPSVLATIPEQAFANARMRLHPALRLLELRCDVPALATSVRNAAGAGQALPGACFVAVYRAGLTVTHETMGRSPFRVLQALATGTPLVIACEAALHGTELTETELADAVGGWFQSWAARGWLIGIDASSAGNSRDAGG